MAITKIERRIRIKKRIRKIVVGTAERPRMSVFRSNKQISVQLIDDSARATLLAVSSLDKEIVAACAGKTKIEQATIVGEAVAKKASAKGLTNVVFDRNGYLYHGRVKSLAEAARSNGLNF
ncbi:MAG: 50S ribosomal protein L18 [Bacteroidales bacterium]|jgi:large subunit ribosomal protein L18|nr:50S ribosomal protein L18 [Bacteroidales bacterium]